MKKAIHLLMILLLTIIFFIPATANAQSNSTTNYQLMQETVKNNYGNKKIKLVNGNGREDYYWNIVLHRKNKSYVVVEKVVSIGNGTRHGWYDTADGGHYIIGYNKRVPKGKRVISYVIWNPYTNEVDDVAFVIDNKMVRG